MTDDIDLAQGFEEMHRSNALAKRKTKKRISTGICKDCQDDIDADRLKALPHAERCIGCQEIFEKRSIGG